MISNNKIKFVKSLHLKKYREEHSLFVAEGVKVVEELLNSSFIIHTVFAIKEWIEQNINKTNNKLCVNEVTQAELNKISALSTPNKVLAVAKIPLNSCKIDACNKLILVIDKIRDPGNLGTIIRTAEWFGFNDLLLTSSSVDVWNQKVIQASMGSIFRVNVNYVEVKYLLENLSKNTPIYGATLDGANILDIKLQKNGILIVGNESHGISDEIMPFITQKIKIPTFNSSANNAESLNISIATALLCYEFKRGFNITNTNF